MFPDDDGARCNLKSCTFFASTINNLSHIIHRIQVEAAEHANASIHDLNPVTNIMEVQTFLSLYIVFWRLVTSSEPILAALNKKPRKDHPEHMEAVTEDGLGAQKSL